MLNDAADPVTTEVPHNIEPTDMRIGVLNQKRFSAEAENNLSPVYMKELYYNIQGQIEVLIRGSRFGTALRQIDTEYKHFRTDAIADPDLVINLGPFEPTTDETTVLDDKFEIADDYLYTYDSYKYAHWEFEASGFEDGPLTINIDANLVGRSFVTGIVIDPFLFYLLNESGCPVIHASCVRRGGCGYAFAGPSGSGKTTHAVEMTERGFEILADDSVVLSDGTIGGIPYPLNVFAYNLHDSINAAMSRIKRTEFLVKRLVETMTGYGRVTKVNIAQLQSFTDASVELDSVFVMRRGREYSVETLTTDRLVERLLSVQKLDNIYFYKYVIEYSYAYPDSSLANHWDSYERNLRNELSDVNAYDVKIPIDGEKQFDKIERTIEGQG